MHLRPHIRLSKRTLNTYFSVMKLDPKSVTVA